jgi:cholesterol transport system auxiliary component
VRALFIVLIILLCSCSTNSKQVAQHDFGLQSTSSRLNHSEISVTMPQWLWNQCIHYRLLYSSSTQLSCYSLDQWIAPPPELFKQQLASKISTHHRVIIELGEFEQQFDSPTTARVMMAMRVSVYAPHSEKQLASKDFRFEQVSATPDAAGAVAGFASLTRQATDRIQSWLAGLASTRAN